jgi:hypothetical protein
MRGSIRRSVRRDQPQTARPPFRRLAAFDRPAPSAPITLSIASTTGPGAAQALRTRNVTMANRKSQMLGTSMPERFQHIFRTVFDPRFSNH